MMSEEIPYFTVCIPTYNRANVITRTLESLWNQTYKNFETIIVDDGSTDNTAEVAKAYPDLNIRYIYKENGGKYTALNRGIKEANGFMFLILDSDDWLVENALERMRELWQSIPESARQKYSGIMGRCRDTKNLKMVGNSFPKTPFVSSYVDFHFISGPINGGYGDCCECNRTELLKKYFFPENQDVKFVPEYYIFDQIGVEYKLLCTNEIFKNVEYLDDGMTNNASLYYRKNFKGILYGLVSRLENVFPKTEEKIPLQIKMEYWKLYWYWKKIIDVDGCGPKVNKMSILRIYSYFLWLISYVFKE